MPMERQSIFKELSVIHAGVMDYHKAWELQRLVFNKVKAGESNDTLILIEHPHTYTLGKVTDKANLIANEEYLSQNGITVVEIDRGGDITYHGPGQLVGYPIIDLKKWKQDSHLYLRQLEEVLIQTLSGYGISSGRKEGLTGVWIEERKIAAIGIKISSWVTMHGFACNVNTDLAYFGGIIPCGITDKAVTSLHKELNQNIDFGEFKSRTTDKFAEIFGYTQVSNADIYDFSPVKEVIKEA